MVDTDTFIQELVGILKDKTLNTEEQSKKIYTKCISDLCNLKKPIHDLQLKLSFSQLCKLNDAIETKKDIFCENNVKTTKLSDFTTSSYNRTLQYEIFKTSGSDIIVVPLSFFGAQNYSKYSAFCSLILRDKVSSLYVWNLGDNLYCIEPQIETSGLHLIKI